MLRPKELYALVRFGRRDHLEAFRNTGQIYMNTLRFFQKLEADALRSDKGEGLQASFAASKAQLHVQSGTEWMPIEGLFGAIRVSDIRDEDRNVFCLYGITEQSATTFFDPRVLSFGEAAVLITHGDEFLNRVRTAVSARGWSVGHNLVEYVEEDDHVGPMGPFRKYSDFEYQSEFRIVAITGRKAPVADLFVGDLTDITRIYRSAEIRTQLRIQPA